MVGNAHGAGGFGVGKALDVRPQPRAHPTLASIPSRSQVYGETCVNLYVLQPATATARAIREAKKHLIIVDRYKVGEKGKLLHSK